MSGLVSVSWKRHCIYICQHNIWQNIFLKLAFLPEYFTRTHACAHVPAIWCSYTLLSWRVKIRCTFHVRSLQKVLLTCKRCLARALVWRSRVSVLYTCIPWACICVCVSHMKAVSSENNWVPVPALSYLPGNTSPLPYCSRGALDRGSQTFCRWAALRVRPVLNISLIHFLSFQLPLFLLSRSASGPSALALSPVVPRGARRAAPAPRWICCEAAQVWQSTGTPVPVLQRDRSKPAVNCSGWLL